MLSRRNLIIALMLISPFIVASGELFWQAVLVDLLGMRDIDWCVSKVLDQNLRPQVEDKMLTQWEETQQQINDDEPNEIIFYAAELTSAMQDQFFTPENIDLFALQTTELTSCKDIDAAHWHVRVNIVEAIDAASWNMINTIFEESLSNP